MKRQLSAVRERKGKTTMDNDFSPTQDLSNEDELIELTAKESTHERNVHSTKSSSMSSTTIASDLEYTPRDCQPSLQADADASKTLIGRGEENLQVLFQNVKNRIHVKEATDSAKGLAKHVIEAGKRGWRVVGHGELPEWLRDNDFIDHGHRPPLDSFKLCFQSIFYIHAETGNIWTHLLGFIAFVFVALCFYIRPLSVGMPFLKDLKEKFVFGAFFGGALFCLAFSTLYHTMGCHSYKVSNIFSRLDYTGIALLIVGSFIPCLYYGFFCYIKTKIIYMTLVSILGLGCIFVAMWEKFNTPKYRALRAAVFVGLGCSGVVPCLHILIAHGLTVASKQASLGWLLLMASLYLTGALLYASRIPERFFPGKCNIWFQSHQIFHILVVAGAFVHFHGVRQMAYYRFAVGSCPG